MIDITSREASGVTVVDIEGKMNTEASPDAEKFVNALLEDGVINLLFNFERLDFVASTGLRVILSTGKKLSKIGGRLVLCSPNLTVMDVLKMSGFSKMFNVFDTEGEALSSFTQTK
jgi:anti-anti-sigma factor